MTSTAPFPSDLEIARAATPRPIVEIANDLGFAPDEIEPYGHTKAKVTIEGIRRLEAANPRGRYVVSGRSLSVPSCTGWPGSGRRREKMLTSSPRLRNSCSSRSTNVSESEGNRSTM